MRDARVSWEVVGAYEVWDILVPDDAPDPLTGEWLNENMHLVEFCDLNDSGFTSLVNPEIEE